MDESKSESAVNYEARVEGIVSRFSSHRKSVRIQAAAELADLGPQAIEAILKAANREKQHWVNTAGTWAIISMCIGPVAAIFFRSDSKHWLWWPLIRFVIFGIPLVWAAKSLIDWHASREIVLGRFVPPLCGINDIRVLDLLICGYGLTTPDDQRKIESVIPSLIASDHQQAWDSLQPATRTRLISMLYAGSVKFKSTAAIQAVLDMLAECGGSQELKVIQKLAQRSKTEEVKEKAKQVAAIVSARLEAGVEASALLRPASDVGEDHTRLVRAADSANAAGTETLLRPDSTGSVEDVAVVSLHSQK